MKPLRNLYECIVFQVKSHDTIITDIDKICLYVSNILGGDYTCFKMSVDHADQILQKGFRKINIFRAKT